jgi:hypothetical protein
MLKVYKELATKKQAASGVDFDSYSVDYEAFLKP